jgi:hypothetical protein
VLIGWALFSVEELTAFVKLIKILFGGKSSADVFFDVRYYLNNKIIFTLITAAIASTPYPKIFIKRFSVYEKPYYIIQYVVLLCMFIVCLSFTISGNFSPFIYFQF